MFGLEMGLARRCDRLATVLWHDWPESKLLLLVDLQLLQQNWCCWLICVLMRSCSIFQCRLFTQLPPTLGPPPLGINCSEFGLEEEKRVEEDFRKSIEQKRCQSCL